MSVHLPPSARMPAPTLSPSPGASSTDPFVSRAPLAADSLAVRTPGLGTAGVAHRRMPEEAVSMVSSLSARIAQLPEGTATATIRASAQSMTDAVQCLLTANTDNAAGMSVEQLASTCDHINALQQSSVQLKAALGRIKSQSDKPLEASQKKTLVQELLQLSHQLKQALVSSLHEFSVAGPAIQAAWKTSDSKLLLDALQGPKANPTGAKADPTPKGVRGAGEICLALKNWENVWRADVTRALEMLPSAMLLPSPHRAAVHLQYENLLDQLNKVRACKENLASPLTADTATKIDHFIATLQHAICSLQCVLNVVDDYQSPHSVQAICDAKLIEIDAALAVLGSEPGKHSELTELLQARREAIATLRDHPGDADARRLLGKPPVTGVARLLRPFDAIRQQLRLDKAVARMLEDPHRIAHRDTLETEHFSETQFLARLLKADRISDANKRLSAAIGEVLNQRPWNAITSRIVVPVGTGSLHDSQPVSTISPTSVVTPAGHVLNDPARVQFLSTDSPINTRTVSGYQHTDSEGRKVTGGFNSHDAAECTHAVMAAHTELMLNGKVLLGATRTGVQAPYELDGDYLKAMPVNAAAQLIRGVLGPAQREATRVVLQSAQTVPQTGQAKLRSNLIRAEVAQLLGPQAKLLEPGSDDSALVQAIAENPQLTGQLVRQAALNRARETLLVELARTPAFAEQIARGETLSFMSLSLLTPDALRTALAAHSPSLKEFDEKTMIQVQVQAWKDLQAEIDDGGIIVNSQTIKARLLAFNFGVNAGAVGGIARNRVLGEAISGTAFANQLTNAAAMHQLIGSEFSGDGLNADDNADDNAVDRYLARTDATLAALTAETPPAPETIAKIGQIVRDKVIVKQLREQISEIWTSGSYAVAGNEPYKLVSRLLVLHHLIGGGSQFNCKSGKDRTGQLDVEAKFLAFQIEQNNGEVPLPDRHRTKLERIQFAAFVFQDEARRTMQAYATGYGGSKLAGVPSLYRNFLVDVSGLKDAAKRVIAEFMGLAHFTKV